VEHAREKYEVSERHACRLLGQWRRTQRYAAIQKIDEEALTEAIIALASEYGRYGYRRITALLQRDGWQVGRDRLQRIWRREGLKVPQKQRLRRRLWLNDGSCIRQRPERANHVWSYDFVSAMMHDGRTLRMLTLLDEYTRESLAIRVARRLGRYEVIEALADVMLFRGIPENIRSDKKISSFKPSSRYRLFLATHRGLPQAPMELCGSPKQQQRKSAVSLRAGSSPNALCLGILGAFWSDP
jgi:putative transposase